MRQVINDFCIVQDSFFAIGGIGQNQLKMNSVAISIGAGIRIGLEDNLWFDKGRTKLASNSDLLMRAKTIIEANESVIMTSKTFREN